MWHYIPLHVVLRNKIGSEQRRNSYFEVTIGQKWSRLAQNSISLFYPSPNLQLKSFCLRLLYFANISLEKSSSQSFCLFSPSPSYFSFFIFFVILSIDKKSFKSCLSIKNLKLANFLIKIRCLSSTKEILSSRPTFSSSLFLLLLLPK